VHFKDQEIFIKEAGEKTIESKTALLSRKCLPIVVATSLIILARSRLLKCQIKVHYKQHDQGSGPRSRNPIQREQNSRGLHSILSDLLQTTPPHITVLLLDEQSKRDRQYNYRNSNRKLLPALSYVMFGSHITGCGVARGEVILLVSFPTTALKESLW
jgi:hypothetical protein